jgi:hypothetical protein
MQRGRSTNTPVSVPPTPAPQAPTPSELIESERECSDEEDFELLIGFDPRNATNRLFTMSNSIQLTIK